MAKLEYQLRKSDEEPASVERIEVRPWALGGKSHQEFAIGSGSNFDATDNIWLEIIYSVNQVPLFHARNFLHRPETEFSFTEMQERLEKFSRGEQDRYGFGDMFPETSIFLGRDKFTYRDGTDEEKISVSYYLEVSVDAGVVMGRSSPGMRMIKIKLNYIGLEDGVEFMRDLTREIGEVYQGRHPNPARLPAQTSGWHFVHQLNQAAYDLIAEDYEGDYFENPMFGEMFDSWLREVSTGGHILDAGCGTGQPVISRLLERGYCVTGVDSSPKMLARARENFPNVTFIQQLTAQLQYESEFDGACSLSSLLYLDPIDLSYGLYRLQRALKPGSLLFLYAFDLHPSWRGNPYHVDLKHWMWAWTYGMEEAVDALEEHGYFKVLKAQDVTTEQQKEENVEHWRKSTQKRYEETRKYYSGVPEPDLSRPPENLTYCYTIIAQRLAGDG